MSVDKPIPQNFDPKYKLFLTAVTTWLKWITVIVGLVITLVNAIQLFAPCRC